FHPISSQPLPKQAAGVPAALIEKQGEPCLGWRLPTRTLDDLNARLAAATTHDHQCRSALLAGEKWHG
ncbi:TPA: hypothetical protein ACP30Z_006219, partial [Pseudomonas aeruginosa]